MHATLSLACGPAGGLAPPPLGPACVATLSLACGPAGGLAPPPLGPACVAALEARQLRLLAYAVGDHLPVELAVEVAQLEARRRALLGAPAYC